MDRFRHTALLVLLLGALAVGMPACGSDDGDRGLQPAGEVAVPDSPGENALTEEERAKERIAKEQGRDAAEFEDAEGH